MVQSNLKDFLKEVEQKVQAYEKQRYKWCVDNILMANKMLVNSKPVDTGLFRSNHIVTYNSKTNKTRDKSELQSTVIGDKTIYSPPSFEVTKKSFKNGDTITIQNNLDYADYIEAGHSKQAPMGVYGIVEERMRIEINKKVKV